MALIWLFKLSMMLYMSGKKYFLNTLYDCRNSVVELTKKNILANGNTLSIVLQRSLGITMHVTCLVEISSSLSCPILKFTQYETSQD